MALQFYDGLDLYGSLGDMAYNGWSMGGGPGFSTTGGRFGGSAFSVSNYYSYVRYNLNFTGTEVWFGFAVNATGGGAIAGIGGPSGTECEFDYAGGVFSVLRGGTVIGSATHTMSGSAWHWLEFHYKIGNGSGVVEVWMDGNQIIDLTSVDNTYYNSSAFTGMYVGSVPGNGFSSLWVDDFYLLDTTGSAPYNTRLGDCRIETLKPTSDAGPNNGTPSSGSSHYAMVDENQNDGDTSYLTVANTSGQEELFGVGSLSGTPANVLAVKVTNLVKKTDAGACDGEAVLSSSGVVATGPSTGLITSYSVVSGMFTQDPNTSAPWVYSAVNAVEVGFEVP